MLSIQWPADAGADVGFISGGRRTLLVLFEDTVGDTTACEGVSNWRTLMESFTGVPAVYRQKRIRQAVTMERPETPAGEASGETSR